MTPALRRVWWALGAVLVVLVGWFVRSGMPPAEPAPPVGARPVPRVLSTLTPTPVADATGSTATEPAAAAPHGSDEVELCGGRWVRLKEDGNVDDDDLNRVARVPEARAALIEALRTDADEFARAAAILLGVTDIDPTRPATAAARDALARLAATTTDPRVYAMAFNACEPARGDGACQLLNAEQWARLDPGNATPWLFLLTEAGQRRDTAAQSEALHRIATAQRSDQHFFDMAGLVIDRMPGDDASAPARLTLAAGAIGIVSAWSLPGYQSLYDACKTSTLRDANRRQSCNDAAELLVARADTLLERGVGVALGKRLGWSDERVERLRGEQSAYGDSLGDTGSDWSGGGCAAIQRDLAVVARHARLGEAGALREWVAQSGLRPEDFIRAEREARARLVAAAAAASAASAASAAR